MLNPNRHVEEFKQARLVLDSGATEGEVLTYDGEFQILIEHDGTNDVNFQIRVPAPKKPVGSWVAVGEWKTIAMFDSDFGDTLKMCSNFEYRFETSTAGARVFLGVQKGAIG